ncbi:MAG: SDR family oxidoreductase [Rubrivivax sp.]
MRVLVCGATGFIGRPLTRALLERGHGVVGAARRPQRIASSGGRSSEAMAADFTRDVSMAAWLPRLAGIDAVVNAVGILRESRGLHGPPGAHGQRFEELHVRAPMALFDACLAAGVRRVVQLSALGADEEAASAYHRSKRRADLHLLSLPLPLTASVVQPSLVYGPGGASAALFETLASLPLLPLPSGGLQRIQPLHLDDLVEGLCVLVEDPTAAPPGRIAFVGPQALALSEYLAVLREGMQLPPARVLPVPRPLAQATAAIAGWLPGVPLDREALQMLERGNTGAAEPLARLLGRAARAPSSFIDEAHAGHVRHSTRLRWALPPLRWAIAAVWIVTGVLSFGVYPVEDSRALLARLGIEGALATLMLYGAAALDLLLGLATLVLKRRAALWWAQIGLMLGYTALITWRLPEFWLHPFGPILKNLPLLAAIGVLLALEERPPRNT